MNSRACSVADCGGRHHSGGFCQRHYNVQRREEAGRRRNKARGSMPGSMSNTTALWMGGASVLDEPETTLGYRADIEGRIAAERARKRKRGERPVGVRERKKAEPQEQARGRFVGSGGR